MQNLEMSYLQSFYQVVNFTHTKQFCNRIKNRNSSVFWTSITDVAFENERGQCLVPEPMILL